MPEEKILTINLRKLVTKSPRWKRSRRTVNYLRQILEKHAKGGEVKIDKKLNEQIWEKSSRNPKMKLRVKLKKTDKNVLVAEPME